MWYECLRILRGRNHDEIEYDESELWENEEKKDLGNSKKKFKILVHIPTTFDTAQTSQMIITPFWVSGMLFKSLGKWWDHDNFDTAWFDQLVFGLKFLGITFSLSNDSLIM